MHQPSIAPDIRASDSERELIVTRLSEHAAAGRLTLAELEERIGLAYSSTTRADLAKLIGDLPKGDAAAVARVAGIMAAKRTAELIPLCHPIPLTGVELSLESSGRGIRVIASVRTTDRTGVEMEAMTAVAVASLTIYDMVKGVDRDVTIETVRLLSKSGGRSGKWERG